MSPTMKRALIYMIRVLVIALRFGDGDQQHARGRGRFRGLVRKDWRRRRRAHREGAAATDTTATGTVAVLHVDTGTDAIATGTDAIATGTAAEIRRIRGTGGERDAANGVAQSDGIDDRRGQTEHAKRKERGRRRRRSFNSTLGIGVRGMAGSVIIVIVIVLQRREHSEQHVDDKGGRVTVGRQRRGEHAHTDKRTYIKR